MDTFAVVPIFTTAGAALLPTIVAFLASVAAIAFRPRELLRLGRQRPLTMGISLGAMALVLVVVAWWFGSATPVRSAAGAEPQAMVHYDWARVAEAILNREQAGKVVTALTDDAPSAVPLVLGHDFSRCSYGGGPSPVQLKRLWTFAPEDTMFLSSTAVAGKRVYAAGCQRDLGGYTGLLACLDAETGQPLWQTTQAAGEVLRPFFSSPALTADGKYLVVGQGLHADDHCSLLCFDTATGHLHWALKTSLHLESSPALNGDVAVVGAGAIEGPNGQPVGDPGFVLAVRIADGQELWRQAVNDPESSPAIDDHGTVLIGSGFNGNAIVALRIDAENRLRERQLDRIAWRTPLEQPVTCPITLAGDLVIAGAGNSDIVHSNRNAQRPGRGAGSSDRCPPLANVVRRCRAGCRGLPRRQTHMSIADG